MIMLVFEWSDSVSHCLVYEPAQVISGNSTLLMSSRIPLPSDMIDCGLQQEFGQDSVCFQRPHSLYALHCPMPVGVYASPNESLSQAFPHCIGIKTSKEEMVSRFIPFSTEFTSFYHSPLPHTIACRQSILHSQPSNKHKSWDSLCEPYNSTPLYYSPLGSYLFPHTFCGKMVLIIIIPMLPQDSVPTLFRPRRFPLQDTSM